MALRRDDVRVQGMRAREFERFFRERWAQGEHVALVGPTGEGKSTTAVTLLRPRKWVFALDQKGGDSTLATSGYERLTDFGRTTRRGIERRVERAEPVRFIVGAVARTKADLVRNRELCRQVLEYAFEVGGWTVYVDELQVAADRRMMNLGAELELLYIAARDKLVSVVGSFQAPRHVPRAASDQSTWIIVFYTRDVDVVNRLAEMTGRPKEEIRGAVAGVDRHFMLAFNRSPRAPIIVTKLRPLRGE